MVIETRTPPTAQQRASQTHSPRLAVIIPCHAVDEVLERQLRALAQQPPQPAFEVILADNGGSDELVALCRRFSESLAVRIADARRAAGINVARNEGVAALSASVELVLFCDADDRVHPGWVDAYWRAYLAGGLLMGGALHRISEDLHDGSWQRGATDSLAFLPWPPGANCAVAREVLTAVGPFDESFQGGGDETDFFWRAQLSGYELTTVGEAAIDYVQRPTLLATFRQSRAYARSHDRLFRAYRHYGMPVPTIRASLAEVAARTRAVVETHGDRATVRHLVAGLGLAAGRLLKLVPQRPFLGRSGGLD